jgi:thiol-disulfide isomerase/thioredoxin
MRALFAILILATLPTSPAVAQLALDAATAWRQVQSAAGKVLLVPPLNGRLPTKAELEAHRRQQRQSALDVADMAREFTRRFPANLRTDAARDTCHKWLEFAIRRGAHDRSTEIRAVEKEMLSQAKLTEDRRFQIRQAAVDRESAIAQAQGGDVMAAYEKGVRELQRDFPNRPETYQMLYAVAVRSSGTKAKQLAEEILRGPAPASLKTSVKAILERARLIGEPLRIKFTATNGRKIDTARMKGKVILLDFWASWSAPSISQLGKLEKIYADYADKSVEILEISFDHERRSLDAIAAHRKIPWPQHFDQGTKGKTLREVLGVKRIPSLWLIDKQGILRDTNASRDLEKQLDLLLAEPAK